MHFTSFLSPTTPEEILTVVNRPDSKKSCGYNDNSGVYFEIVKIFTGSSFIKCYK